MALASVALPASLFPPDAPSDCKLQFVAFRNGRFFPTPWNSSGPGDPAGQRSVNSPVAYVGLGKLGAPGSSDDRTPAHALTKPELVNILVALRTRKCRLLLLPFPFADGCSMWNHSEPVVVSLRHTSTGSDPVAAHWSQRALERPGGWSQEGCHLIHSDRTTSTLHCSLLSNYAILQVTTLSPSHRLSPGAC